jgi:acyl-CoA thioester hydrolase
VGTLVLETAVLPDWIDYNGHMRDAYYAVAVSLGLDALMDQVGLDETYRNQTSCTLYSVEMHLHWLKEVKSDQRLALYAHVLDFDAKRLLVGMDIKIEGNPDNVASAETMLVHVCQKPEVKVVSFPDSVQQTLKALHNKSLTHEWAGPRSKALAIFRKPKST